MKGKTVLVRCIVVDSDGYPVDQHGNTLSAKGKPWFTWEKRYRTFDWMKRHPKMWRKA